MAILTVEIEKNIELTSYISTQLSLPTNFCMRVFLRTGCFQNKTFQKPCMMLCTKAQLSRKIRLVYVHSRVGNFIHTLVLSIMAIPVVEFSNQGYKIRKIFA